MKKGKIAALVSAALVAGLVLGTLGVATAAPSTAATATTGFGAICRQAGGTIADIVAKVTGTSVTDVYAKRATGESFAQIASASGVSADTLTSEVLAARKAALADAVKAGTITQAQADAVVAKMTTRVSSRITNPAPAGCTGTGSGAARGAGSGGGFGGGRRAGCGGAGACVAAPTAQ